MLQKNISKSAQEIRKMIDKAINSHEITRNDYNKIINIATEDSVIDSQEKILLAQLNDMLEDNTIKFVKNYKK